MNIMLRSNSSGFSRELRIFKENCTGRKTASLDWKEQRKYKEKNEKTSESPNSTGLKQAEETTELLAQVPFYWKRKTTQNPND